MKKPLSIALGLIFSAAPLWADPAAPENPCLWPDKPPKFESHAEAEAFRESANGYKNCLDAFVRDQEEAIRAHRWAADEAMSEWESFKRREID